jgi:RNA polymerase sigma-70 factor (ECF subfamily)
MTGSGGLGAVFAAHLEGLGRALPGDLDEALDRLWRAGRDAWPGLAVDAPLFARHLAERIAPDADLPEALAVVHADDLYLACACAHQVDGALRGFEERFAGTVVASVRRVDASPAFVDDVRQALRQRLFVSEGGEMPRISGYSGRGPLSAWVAIAARRLALNAVRSRDAGAFAVEAEGAEEPIAHGDPEIDYLRMRYRDAFREAFREAIAGLDRSDRMLLRLSYVKGLSHDKIAVAYKVHQTTITRRIRDARTALMEGIQGRLRRRLQADTMEVHSIARWVGSQLDLSLTRLLGDDDPA